MEVEWQVDVGSIMWGEMMIPFTHTAGCYTTLLLALDLHCSMRLVDTLFLYHSDVVSGSMYVLGLIFLCTLI